MMNPLKPFPCLTPRLRNPTPVCMCSGVGVTTRVVSGARVPCRMMGLRPIILPGPRRSLMCT